MKKILPIFVSMYYRILIPCLLFFSCFVACQRSDSASKNKKNQQRAKNGIVSDTSSKVNETIVPKQEYQLVALQDTLGWINQMSDDSMSVLLVLNRVDAGHLRNLDSIIVPKRFENQLDAYCPFPSYVDSLVALNKVIYVSRLAQLFAVYENGQRIKWGPTSTGKKATETPKGLFSTNWKRKRNISSINSSWILNWCFNISNGDGVSFHEYDLPGYPASHACARLFASDAEWIYHWADQWMLKENLSVLAFGTPVIIFDDYPFEERKPWWRLVEKSSFLNLSTGQLWKETQPYFDLILERQKTLLWERKQKEESKSLAGKVI